MHLFFYLLLEAVLSFLGWPSRRHEDRSIVGESRLDRESHWFGRLVVLVVLAIAVWAYYFRG